MHVTEQADHDKGNDLLDEAQQFRLLLNGVTDYAIYLLDPDGRVKTWNQGGERIKGYSRDEIVGSHFSRFYTPEDVAAGAPQRSLNIAREQGRFSAEGWRIRKDGSRFFASVVIDPIWAEGELIGYAKVTRDITERFESQRRLEDAQTSLLQAQKLEAVGRLTLGLAHDFNNLLAVVINALDLIAIRVTDDPRATRNVEAALRAAERGALLTRQLLTFGRGQNLVPQRLDVNQSIRNIQDLIRRSCSDNIRLNFDLAADLPEVEVDKPQFEAAVLNAVVNSRDAMPEGGDISITTSLQHVLDATDPHAPAKEMVCVCIADNGPGIPLEIQERVFEPFFTTKGVGKGSGLGLSQIFGFAKQSGGQASLKSTPGQGTSVLICLPMRVEHRD
ncbi:two-component system sensor histidine kinase NtrB [Pseudoxanthomonas winnipegensis]|jgi:PAS domain S-box-containing protein|uniref:histidine kinase n=1 Tax=Pseudoxanthomonas winnipegensis TaxID=2480810 RepID=A0A4V2HCI0_9GAMM|nr:ATP-binding protein [Pseudoxanthomonas winnipegensis]TAA20106.1 PAS domain S-box protein [Pseudoxanthomonas winnipegensis]